MTDKEVEAQKQHIKDFLKALSKTEKLIIVLYYDEEFKLTITEIAKVLESPESEVSQMHSSIIARCKSYLQSKG
jgi:RNA polymerase sigma factor (sigma-70 family)